MKILFLIRSLDRGGAERQLALLAKGLQERGHDIVIAVFYSGGSLEKELGGTGIRILALHKRGRWDLFRFLMRLMRVLRQERPDVIHGYLEESNLLTVILKPFLHRSKTVLGIRSSDRDQEAREDWLDWVNFKLNCRLSKFADAIIANSRVGREFHLSQGYPAEKTVVISNGIDTKRFRPDPTARRALRAEWGASEHEKVIGIVGRLAPKKDHQNFLRAAALLASERKDLRFVCVGDGPSGYRATLQQLATQLGLNERLMWLSAQENIPAVYNALDVLVSSSSHGEGFANVIGEAMACGVPCVVTDVGDSAWVVGDTGEVVHPMNAVALMKAIANTLDRPRCSPAEIRQRILDQSGPDNLVLNTERTLRTLLQASVTR